MAQKIVVYWRDIPAQVIVKAGRKRASIELPERFIKAIDRTAMKLGAKDSDAYLAEWRQGEPESVDGNLEELAAIFAAELEAAYPPERVSALVANGGRADG
ncbi:MAG: virulence factor [Minwuia sp.]|uniref:virulence factor n=1 Tax=Minwuia sp. TaxID=2493630 RepID=UPI003A8A2EEA